MSDPERFNVFDARAMVGRHMRLGPDEPHTVADLIEEMDHYAITEALVLDCLARECHPAEGNARVLEQVKGQPRLHPAWAALPHGPDDEQPAAVQFLEQMRQHRVGALWLLPNQYRFTLDDWCVDAFLEPIADARVPVFVCYSEIGPTGGGSDVTDWRAVVDLCRRHPDLPVIVSELRIRRGQRLAYRALDACPNLRIELSPYWLHRGIEFISGRWGAQRLIFGSNWPILGPHMTLATLTTADIDDADKRRIAGDNLRELIAWCEPEHPRVNFPEPADRFVRFGQSGERPADMVFHDNHGHLGGRFSHYHLPGCTLDGIVADMDRLGVQQTCVFAFTGITSDEQRGNDIVAESVARYPDRFVGFTMLNPHRGPDMMQRELERCHAMGMRGVKLIPDYQGYPAEGPNIDVACAWAHEHRQCILNHNWGGVAQMRRHVETYPDACFFTGHTTTAYAEIMKQHANLYVCSCPLLPPRACEQVVAAIGADRLLFGSDLEDLPIAWGLGPILFARLPEAAKRLILGENLQRILQRYSLPHHTPAAARLIDARHAQPQAPSPP